MRQPATACLCSSLGPFSLMGFKCCTYLRFDAKLYAYPSKLKAAIDITILIEAEQKHM